MTGTCECCGAREVDVEKHATTDTLGREYSLPVCGLCSSSGAWSLSHWGSPHTAVLGAICRVGNEIIKEIRKTRAND